MRYAIKEKWGMSYDLLTDIRELAFYAINGEEIENLCLEYTRSSSNGNRKLATMVWKDICNLRPNNTGYTHFYHWLLLARKEFE